MACQFGGKLFPSNLAKYRMQIRTLSRSLLLRSDSIPKEAIPKNLIEDYYDSSKQPMGKIYDTKPFRMKLDAQKKYAWCCCGHSKSQPLCDGTHKINSLKINIKPILFKVEETKEYWLCNCKQSRHRPFCDGTHLKVNLKNH